MKRNLFVLRADVTHYRSIRLVGRMQVPLTLMLRGSLVRSDWHPPAIEPIDDATGGDLPWSDFPCFGGVPLLARKAQEVLRATLKGHGEVLPTCGMDGQFSILNVTAVADVLDEAGSELTRFESSGHVMSVVRYSFDATKYDGQPIFKIPQLVQSNIFVSDEFVRAVGDARLTGFEFEQVGVMQVGSRLV